MIYKKTQTSYLLLVISAIIIGTQLIALLSKKDFLGEVALTSFFTVTGILILTLLLFSRLTITIDHEKISGAFGFGLIKQKMLLADINPNSIEVIKAPLYYGVGLRITVKGTLYNTKPGKSIRIKSKNGEKTFFVGTDDAENIKNILLQKLS